MAGKHAINYAMQGLKQLEEEGVFTKDSNIVVIFPDHGSRYMSKIYSDEWMEKQGFGEMSASEILNIQYVK